MNKNEHHLCRHDLDYCYHDEDFTPEVEQSVAYDAEADSVAYPPTPFDEEWDTGYMSGSGENMYDDSYIDYLNRY